jgi:hypothetical protein
MWQNVNTMHEESIRKTTYYVHIVVLKIRRDCWQYCGKDCSFAVPLRMEECERYCCVTQKWTIMTINTLALWCDYWCWMGLIISNFRLTSGPEFAVAGKTY